ncbi:hypothetical protein [Cupriavidus campinensis]|uniref:Uncharacterized protein n=1 Tax=Cupriavidus campinensis TaxID=151783 RepID=A0AAE9L3N2_9BURK|nr:hypothetical protein [Cupriavidus campinensis]URF05265.1 hypothetical protein M5D45_05440 [Cupriavidus campinensis]
METLTHSDHARIALLQGLAGKLANMAADALEPYAGTDIGPDARERLAADVCKALRDNMPTLLNVKHALDMIPPAG